jgi:penicillin-binding protein 1A
VAEGDLIRVRPDPESASWSFGQVPELQAALVSLDPQTGAVLALEGGSDFTLVQFNHALQAARQPGSGFKPFVYSAAIAQGLSPASVFMDAPLVFGGRDGGYRPSNDDRRYNGPTRLREALYRSINLVTMRVMLEIGADALINHVSRFGFDISTFPRNTQLAVGGGTMAITPIQMAVAYSVFANGGWRIEPWIVDHVVDLQGNQVFKTRPHVVCPSCPPASPTGATGSITPADSAGTVAAAPAPTTVEPTAAPAEPAVLPAERVLDERIAFIMQSMLRDVVAKGTGRRALALGRSDLAGKTGTTDEAADTWFNGFNLDVVTSVWVGFPSHAPLGAREYGSNNPLPIWMDYMKVALEGRPERFPAQPPGVVTMRIDTTTGRPAPGGRPADFEYFLEEHAPSAVTSPGPSLQSAPADGELQPVDIF